MPGKKEFLPEKKNAEIVYGISKPLHPIVENLIPSAKSMLMFSTFQLPRLFVVGFMILVGYALGKAFYHNSIMGILLGFTSLGAGVYFLYLLNKARTETENEENY